MLKILYLLTLLLLINNAASASVSNVKIGAIFFSGEEDLEQSFQSSIGVSNRRFYEMKLIPIIRYAPTDDSTILQNLVCDLISNGTTAIFGPSSKTSSDIVESICHHLGIPHVKFDWSHDETLAEKQYHKMTVNVYPSISALSKAYADVVSNYGWRQFTIIYDEDISIVKLEDVLELHPIHKLGIRTQKINPGEPYGGIWKLSRYNQEQKIILDCSPEIVNEVLNSAVTFNMTEQFHSIFLTNLDTHTVDLRGFSPLIRANVTTLKISVNDNSNLLPVGPLKNAIIFDAVQLFVNALQYLIRYQNAHLSEPRARCEIPTSRTWNLGLDIVDAMKRVNTVSEDEETFITKRMEFNEYGERISFNLDIYRPLRQLTVAVWGPPGQFYAKKETAHLKESVQDTQESRPHYRVATRIGEPYLTLRPTKEGEILQGNARYQGYSLDLINKLSQQLDFDYSIEIVPDGKYGSLNPVTMEWDGILRQLIDNKAEIGICDLTITHERRQAVDFTVPFMSLGISILYYKEPPVAPDLFSFLKPFALEVWIYMATAYLIVSILLFLLARIAAAEYENPHPCNPNPEEVENKWCITNTTWLTMGSLMGQGSDILPITGPMRLVNAMWWFFALMMLNSYTANLAAFLTSSRQQSSISSINDLAEQNKIHFGTVDGGSTSTFFKESNDSIYRLAWSKMRQAKPTVFTKDNNEGLERVKKSKGLYAFLMETTSLEYMTERNCDVMSIGEQIGEKHYGIAVPFGAEYRSNLSVAILKLSEKGEMFALKKKWWKTHNVTCEKIETGGNTELTIANVGGVFLVTGIGLFIAWSLGICEFLWNVQQIAVEEKITPFEAFKQEAIFTLKFWIIKKPIRMNESISYHSQSRRSSQSQSQLQNVNFSNKSALIDKN